MIWLRSSKVQHTAELQEEVRHCKTEALQKFDLVAKNPVEHDHNCSSLHHSKVKHAEAAHCMNACVTVTVMMAGSLSQPL